MKPFTTRPPAPLTLLMALYALLGIAAIARAVTTQTVDMFSLGVIPVLIGLLWRASWASLVLKIYIGLETLGLSALGIVAIVAHYVSPKTIENVRFMDLPISIPWVALLCVGLITAQVWVAFHSSTKAYLSPSEPSID
ncbi:hypothetical protein [Shewanella sp. SR44-3]|uniref:hypothetical protein n=1 Tax=unclassified Shewanella TaxID=196818 RepID=UPI002175ED23|nr:hypothetical protein [Shewanella sp. SR44-3]